MRPASQHLLKAACGGFNHLDLGLWKPLTHHGFESCAQRGSYHNTRLLDAFVTIETVGFFTGGESEIEADPMR